MFWKFFLSNMMFQKLSSKSMVDALEFGNGIHIFFWSKEEIEGTIFFMFFFWDIEVETWNTSIELRLGQTLQEKTLEEGTVLELITLASWIRTKAPMGTTRAITPKSSTPLTSSYKPKKKDKQFIFKWWKYEIKRENLISTSCWFVELKYSRSIDHKLELWTSTNIFTNSMSKRKT